MTESFNLLQPTEPETPEQSPKAVETVAEKPTSTLLYSSENSSPDLAKVGFDIPVEQKSQAKSTLQIAEGGDDVIENIVKQATNTEQSEQRILDDLAQMDSKFELDLPVSSDSLAPVKFAKTIFTLALLITFLSSVYYFGSQNNLFGLGKVNYVSQSQQKLVNLQTEKTLNHYVLVSIAIDDLSVRTSGLNAAVISGNTTEAKKHKAASIQLLSAIKSNLNAATAEIAKDSNIPVSLADKVELERKKYADLASAENDELKKNAFKNLEKVYFSAQQIFTTPDLRIMLVDADFESFSDKQLLALNRNILALFNQNSLSQVAVVEVDRINWTAVFNELEKVIQEFDANFDIFTSSPDYTISLSSYSLNSSTQTFTVNGEVKTTDSRTFTLIANIVDALEASNMFSDLNYTTFSKSFEEEGDSYSSNLTLNFKLENSQ